MMTSAGLAALDKLRTESPSEELPWGGRSPRVLTEAYQRFKLRQEAAPLDEEWPPDSLLEEQNRRFSDGF